MACLTTCHIARIKTWTDGCLNFALPCRVEEELSHYLILQKFHLLPLSRLRLITRSPRMQFFHRNLGRAIAIVAIFSCVSIILLTAFGDWGSDTRMMWYVVILLIIYVIPVLTPAIILLVRYETILRHKIWWLIILLWNLIVACGALIYFIGRLHHILFYE